MRLPARIDNESLCSKNLLQNGIPGFDIAYHFWIAEGERLRCKVLCNRPKANQAQQN